MNQWTNSWNAKQAEWPTATPAAIAVSDPAPQPVNPWDAKSKDECLVHWSELQKALATAKEAELEFRKYIVKREFPQPKEGMNNQDLGNGYTLKAAVKYNYKLDPDNTKIEDCLDRIAKLGNEGPFIADRLISWTPNFLLTEYRQLCENAESGSEFAKSVLKELTGVLTVTDAAPSLEIKEPKAKKK